MTKQTEKIHIMVLVQEMIERLEYIHLQPNNIFIYIDTEFESEFKFKLKKLYPNAKFNQDKSADLILAVFTNNISDIEALLIQFKANLNPSGLLMFGGLNMNFILQDIGDFLQHLGFVNIVMDKEMLSVSDEIIYGHAWMPEPQKPVKISVNQILSRK